jgi:hypothetical protein
VVAVEPNRVWDARIRIQELHIDFLKVPFVLCIVLIRITHLKRQQQQRQHSSSTAAAAVGQWLLRTKTLTAHAML